MPLAKVSGGVAVLFKNGGDGYFGWLKHARHGVGDAIAVGIAPGVATATSGRAHRGAGVKAGESHPFGLHLIEVGSLEVRMSVVANIAPTLVIRHDEEDIGMVCRKERG